MKVTDLNKKTARTEAVRRWRTKQGNTKKEKARRKKAYAENQNGLRDKIRAYEKENWEHIYQKSVEYRKSHPEIAQRTREKYRAKYITRGRRDRVEMADYYIAHLISSNSTLDKTEIRKQEDLIEAYKVLLTIKREINVTNNQRQTSRPG